MFTIVARLIFIVNKFFITDRLFTYTEFKLFWCIAAFIWGGGPAPVSAVLPRCRGRLRRSIDNMHGSLNCRVELGSAGLGDVGAGPRCFFLCSKNQASRPCEKMCKARKNRRQ
jgi:hypothetical protein